MKLKNDIVSGIIFGYAFLSFFLFVLIETELKCLLIITYKYGTVPVILFAIFASAKIFPRFFPELKDASYFRQGVFVISFIMLIFAPPYVSLLNAVLPFQKETVIEGHIEKKWIASGKYGQSRRIKLDVINSCNSPYVFIITSDEEFRKLKVGEKYRKTVMRGGLKLTYMWIFER
jgi:hypothetical protein